jgi:hypothetical protein
MGLCMTVRILERWRFPVWVGIRSRLRRTCVHVESGFLIGGLLLGWVVSVHGQIDPIKRRVVQAGYSLPVYEHAPVAGYAFYYLNLPEYMRTNLVLRAAVVPVYLDSELGIREVLGPHTDLGIGLAGGGFADTYNEIRQGDYITAESFTGHSAEGNVGLYHLFNPADRIPLHGILRLGVHGSFYEKESDTDPNFKIPDNQTVPYARVGLRLGGREPYLTPELAGEISIWHESRYRIQHELYGYDGNRTVEEYSGLFWARALLAYTFPKSKQFLEVSLTAGTGVDQDRFSAYRLGGSLSMISEFALTLPGYHIQEISAEDFVQFSAHYLLPLDAKKCWALNTYGSMAVVDYLDGLEQPGHFHSGVGGGLLYQSPSRVWQIGVAYACGFEAIRNHDRNAQTVTFQLQYDLEADLRGDNRPFWDPLISAYNWKGIFRFFSGL